MGTRVKPPPGTRAGLRDELASVAAKLLDNVFRQAGDDDERKYPTLARVVKAVVGEQQWRTRPNQSVIDVIADAIELIPQTFAKRDGRKTQPPGVALGKSDERHMAALLYGYRDSELPFRFVDGAEMPRTYDGDYRSAALRLINAEVSDRSERRVIEVIQEDLADILLQMEREAIEQRDRPVEAQSATDQAESTLVDRPECIDRLRSLIDAGHKVICLWGEPGTGKSTLARQLIQRLGVDDSALFVRCAPMITAVTPETAMFRRDLESALLAEGIDPAELPAASWLSRLCEQLASEPRSSLVVLDNIETDDLIAQVADDQPKIPVILTTRQRPHHEAIACEELGDFTEPQACAFIKRHLPDATDDEVVALARVLGCRPLALEHAVLFVKESPDVSAQEVVYGLATEVTGTLSLVTLVKDVQRNLTRLYGLIVASLQHHDDTMAVLDSFLAVIGGTGIGARERLYLFMQSPAGGSRDRLHFRSGLRELVRRGLVREQQHLARRTLGDGSSEERSTAELVMHALTYSILRDLRDAAPLAIESRYWDFVRSGGHQALPENEANEVEHAYLLLAQWMRQAASEGLPPGWASFCCIDRSTWLALMEPDGDDNTAGTYIVRYATRPDGMYKLDYRTGTWSSLDAYEGHTLFLVISIYNERILPGLQRIERRQFDDEQGELVLQEASPTEQARLDAVVTPADDCQHVIIDPIAPTACVAHDWSVWALCGKRFVPTNVTASSPCADCASLQDSTEHLTAVELVLRQRFFTTQLDYGEPLTATRLYLVRIKLRRELGRLQEAMADLETAWRFFVLVADQAAGVVALGEALIQEALSLPEPPRPRVLSVYENLLRRSPQTPAIRAVLARLWQDRARLLEQWGQTAASLRGYQVLVQAIDAGHLKPNGVKLSEVFNEKEKAERKLGLTSEANATLRRLIAAVEQERGEGPLLRSCLHLAGTYLIAENPEQARQDLERAFRIAQAAHPPDYVNMWDCLMKLSNVAEALGSTDLALQTLQQALNIAQEHVPERREETERAIARLRESRDHTTDGGT